ncbi:hypothetical protein RBU61_14170 [Tissierella sp. MB52-C2]|nr:hypothetical protein [Tissierella sp. MB52-C2]WMM24061.1 hypothetical protein RBU61_14170 [Tissierella sp. MB52-C2]
MTDEQIKEITIALIEEGKLYTGDSNEKTAEKIAEFINKLREETNK